MVKKNNKKASITDIAFYSVVLLAFGMFVLIGFWLTSNLHDAFLEQSTIPTRATDATAKLVGDYTGIIDNSFLMLAIFIAIVTLILAALVRIHPIFIPIYFIGLVVVVLISGILSNIYQEMAASAEFAPYASQLTMIDTILTGLPLFVAVVGILLMVVMYKLWKLNL